MKAAWYLSRGVRVVWLVLPTTRDVVVMTAGESRHGAGETLPKGISGFHSLISSGTTPAERLAAAPIAIDFPPAPPRYSPGARSAPRAEGRPTR